jgi:hypothetical protein
VSAHRGLANLDAELEPFAVKAAGIPEQVGEVRLSSWAVGESVIAIPSRSGSRCDASTVAGLTLQAGMTGTTTAIPVTRFAVNEIHRRPL